MAVQNAENRMVWGGGKGALKVIGNGTI